MNHLLRGPVIAAAFAVAAVGSALADPAAPRAVEDYQAALRAAAGSPVACAPLDNFARITLTGAAPILPLPWIDDDAASTDLATSRDGCLGTTAKPVITFDDKSGTPLLSPLNMEDPAKAYMAPAYPPVPAL